MPLAIFTLYNKNDKPSAVAVYDSDVTIYDLHRYKSGITAYQMFSNIKEIKSRLLNTVSSGDYVVLSGFKDYIPLLDLELTTEKYNVYDKHLPRMYTSGDAGKDNVILDKLVRQLHSSTVSQYQRVIANAAIVYQAMENKGLTCGYVPVYPKWLMDTYSGRSKTIGFNAQGASDDVELSSIDCNDETILLHFDWVSADIRSAALLSGDHDLDAAFRTSDPYTVTIDKLGGKPTRDEAKTFLLRAINSMDSDILQGTYPELSRWIRESKDALISGHPITSILGRKFSISPTRNILSAFNSTMQGSTAHAMHASIRAIWEKLGPHLLLEAHDSIVLTCQDNLDSIKYIIGVVRKIMTRPFNGLLADDPFFPVKVSKGKQWKKWKHLMTFKESHIDSPGKTTY